VSILAVVPDPQNPPTILRVFAGCIESWGSAGSWGSVSASS
jgi:hypothetical protein